MAARLSVSQEDTELAGKTAGNLVPAGWEVFLALQGSMASPGGTDVMGVRGKKEIMEIQVIY